MTATEDPRLAWVAIAITLDLTSIRALTEVQTANQLGVPAAAVSRSTLWIDTGIPSRRSSAGF